MLSKQRSTHRSFRALGFLAGILVTAIASDAFAVTSKNLFREQKIIADVDSVTLSFALKTYSRCMFGDRDIIALDMYRQNSDYRLLLSVEPITADNTRAEPVGEEISREFLLLKNVSLELPRFEEPTLLGVFICKDAKEEGRCAGKELIKPNEALRMHNPEKNKTSDWSPNDKIYFFQPIIVHQDKVWTLSAFNIGDKGEMLRAAAEHQLGEDGEIAGDELNHLVHLDMTMQSEIFVPDSKALQIMLPHFSKRRCFGRGKK